MRLLVVGGSGLLGYKIATRAIESYETFFTYNFRPVEIEGCIPVKLDKCDRDKVHETVKKIKPDLVIDACKVVGAKMIFLSTDYVFDGKKRRYREEDQPNPLNYYAKTKLEAEKIVREARIPYVIARPSVIYGWNPSELAGLKSSSGKSLNFVLWALRKLRNHEEIRIVTDQYSSPTFADNLAECLLTAASSEKQGIYHTAGKSCIKPVTSEVFKQVAERPKRCCLDVSKAEQDFGVKFLTVEEGLSEMRRQETSKL